MYYDEKDEYGWRRWMLMEEIFVDKDMCIGRFINVNEKMCIMRFI